MTAWKKAFVALCATLALAFTMGLAAPARCCAQGRESILSYGMRGFLEGAELGLAVGYLSTGSKWEKREWRNLAFGAGVGALAGVGLGITLGVIDDSGEPPDTGWYVLRDLGYGMVLGALVGVAVGLVESANDAKHRDRREARAGAHLQVALVPTSRALVPMLGASGRF
ncbi:MAG TPA: hypothetical protein VHM19_18510 [Polyangiales bacterium]|nr:hypothetical protein [Polyangiales bacterium]